MKIKRQNVCHKLELQILYKFKKYLNAQQFFGGTEKLDIFAAQSKGEMAEWSNAAVLKTVDLKGSWGSNPYLSAKSENK